MRIIIIFKVLSLASLALGAATSSGDDTTHYITKSMYREEFVKYKGEHEIVNLHFPTNAFNTLENPSSEYNPNSIEVNPDFTLFFVEADIDSEGNRIDQGLFALRQGKATKLLEHGRDAASSSDESKFVFFGAKDGIYIYGPEKKSAEKYGTVNDNIIGIAKEESGDVIYILTENHELFKVSNNGTKKEKIDDVVNAKQMVLDLSNNIYFYSDDKQPYVRTADGVKKIEGLPESADSVNLIKPLLSMLMPDSVPFVIDNSVYLLHANGTSCNYGIEFKPDAKPSAYSPEATVIQYYAIDKKIYEFNLIGMIFGELINVFDDYLNEKANDIQLLASQLKF